MTPLEVAQAFVEAINSRDIDRLTGLMTREHTFIDADGSEQVGRDRMSAGWRMYFELVPDFRIEIADRLRTGNTVVLLGRADGTFVQNGELRPENHWSVPAAWRVVVDSDLVSVWQLYTNHQVMHEILERISEAGR